MGSGLPATAARTTESYLGTLFGPRAFFWAGAFGLAYVANGLIQEAGGHTLFVLDWPLWVFAATGSPLTRGQIVPFVLATFGLVLFVLVFAGSALAALTRPLRR